MMNKIFALLAIVLLSQIGCSTQSSLFPVTSVETYLNQLVDFMENNHMNKATVNWTELRANVQLKGKEAETVLQLNEAILLAFELLNDQTSFFVTTSGQQILLGGTCEDTLPNVATGTSEIGYVKIPTFGGAGVSGAVFAEKMHGEIRDQDHGQLKGWIVDLRQNKGGNMWPMITGIGPILGEGTAGFFIDSNSDEKPFGYILGSSTFDGEPVVTITNAYTLVSPNAKVAILVDYATTNAAEAVAIAFSGKSETKSFGALTCGRASGIQTFQMSDGAVLYLTTSFLIDRNQVNKKGPLTPDEVVSDPTLTFSKAVDWINQ